MSQKASSPRKGKAASGEEAATAGAETPGTEPAEATNGAPPGAPEDGAEAGPAEAADETEGAESEGDAADARAEAAEKRIAELEVELAAARDRHLRALAELENLRKRGERDRADHARYGGVRLARDLLAAQDAFDRLFLVMDDAFRSEQKQFAEGVELIHREILGAFEKHEIRPIVPERNEVFDPHLHQAMFKEIDDDVEPGRIVRVLEKGFRLGDRLLRAARVSLADERVVPAKEDPPPSMPVGGEAPGDVSGDLADGGGAAGNGGM